MVTGDLQMDLEVNSLTKQSFIFHQVENGFDYTEIEQKCKSHYSEGTNRSGRTIR